MRKDYNAPATELIDMETSACTLEQTSPSIPGVIVDDFGWRS